IGGASTSVETRFGRVSGGAFDPLANLGGSLLQNQGIGKVGACNFTGETVPPQANVQTKRRTTLRFGLGLVDAVPDATFTSLAAAERVLNPAAAGRVSVVDNVATHLKSVGKFGLKAQVPSLFVFSGDAYLNEMGVTNPLF